MTQERDPRAGDVWVKVVFGAMGSVGSQITITRTSADTVWFRQKGFGRQVYSMDRPAFMGWATDAQLLKRTGS